MPAEWTVVLYFCLMKSQWNHQTWYHCSSKCEWLLLFLLCFSLTLSTESNFAIRVLLAPVQRTKFNFIGKSLVSREKHWQVNEEEFISDHMFNGECIINLTAPFLSTSKFISQVECNILINFIYFRSPYQHQVDLLSHSLTCCLSGALACTHSTANVSIINLQRYFASSKV